MQELRAKIDDSKQTRQIPWAFHYREVAKARPVPGQWTPELEESEAEAAELITKRCIVVDKDGEPILGYFPRQLEGQAPSKIRKALRRFTRKYLPPKPKADDGRHAKEMEIEGLFKPYYGLYHLTTWFAAGQVGVRKPVVSSDVFGKKAEQNSDVCDLFCDLSELTDAMSIAFAAFNTRAWEAGRDVVDGIKRYLPAGHPIR